MTPYVYFIQAGDGGPIKIGLATDVNARLSNLQATSPLKLRLIRYFGGSIKEEHEFHRAFAKYRLHREWFEPSYEVMRFVNNPLLRTPPGNRYEKWKNVPYEQIPVSELDQCFLCHTKFAPVKGRRECPFCTSRYWKYPDAVQRETAQAVKLINMSVSAARRTKFE